MSKPARLRAEHRTDALGIGVGRPGCPGGSRTEPPRQLAYELARDDGTGVSGRERGAVPGALSRPPEVGERREVRVRVRTDAGMSGWSDPLAVEAGLPRADDWVAAWVAPTEPPDCRRTGRPIACVAASRSSGRSRAPASSDGARGLVDPWLDGARVGGTSCCPGTPSTSTASR
ncbi:MAG: hypothetical protein R2731_09855 [Nocardioides sp.]